MTNWLCVCVNLEVRGYDTDELMHAFERVITDEKRRRIMGENALERIVDYSIEESAGAFLDAISFCCSMRRI
jgi:glycosyltransferase involved in cell wall biosynthesis